jgi:hypothetical protein
MLHKVQIKGVQVIVIQFNKSFILQRFVTPFLPNFLLMHKTYFSFESKLHFHFYLKPKCEIDLSGIRFIRECPQSNANLNDCRITIMDSSLFWSSINQLLLQVKLANFILLRVVFKYVFII